MKSTLIVLLCAVGLLGYSLTLPAYSDQAAFQAGYMRIDPMDPGASEQYQALRERLLTPKYALQDYAITGILVAALVVLMLRTRGPVAPRSIVAFAAIAGVAPFLLVGAYIFELWQAFNRGEVPHWADSVGIPLSRVPEIFWLGVLWSGANLLALLGIPRRDIRTQLTPSWSMAPGLLLVCVATSALGIVNLSDGAYWYAIPVFTWLYLSLSIAAVRMAHVRPTHPAGGWGPDTR